SENSTQLAFIDPLVSDVASLLAHLQPDVEGIVLDRGRGAPGQIARALRVRPAVRAVHILAHGRPGEIGFAASPLSLDTLPEHAGDLGEIGALLGEGTLQLWVCDVARGADGERFMSALQRLTGTPLAAATDLVGAAWRGGAWQLGWQSGPTRDEAPI